MNSVGIVANMLSSAVATAATFFLFPAGSTAGRGVSSGRGNVSYVNCVECRRGAFCCTLTMEIFNK